MKINKEKAWFNIKNLGNKKAQIEIFGVIGWDVWTQQFSRKLKDLGDVTHIDVLISSEGGYVTDGITIFNMLKMHKAEITTHIISHAWSIASIIALAGDKRKMASNATYMVHNPWNFAMGEAEDLRKSADILDTIKETLVTSYMEITDLSEKEISEMMDEETWMTAQEALDKGFVTEITKAREEAASYLGEGDNQIDLAKAKFKNLSQESKSNNGESDMDDKTKNTNPAEDSQDKNSQGILDKILNLITGGKKEETPEKPSDSSDDQIKNLTTENTDLKNQVAEKDKEIQAKDKQIKDMQEKTEIVLNAFMEEKLTVAQAKEKIASDKSNADLKNELDKEPVKDFTKIVDKKPNGEGNEGGDDILAQFEALDGADRTEFYNKHKAEIKKAMDERHKESE